MEPCERCSTGPSGIEGHERLALLPIARNTVPEPRFVLRCVDCGTQWLREFGRGSGVRWLRAAAASGAYVDLKPQK